MTIDTSKKAPDSTTNATELVAAPPLPYALHANLKEYGRRLGAWRIVLALGLTAFLYFRFGFVVWLLSVVAIAALIIGILLILSKRTVTASPEGLETKNAFGVRRSIRYDEIEEVKVFINYYEPSFGVTPRVSIGMRDKSSPIALIGLYWPVEELDRLLAVLRDKKVATEYYADPAGYQIIAKQFPTYATYLERHTGLVAAIATVAIIVAVVIIAIVITLN